MAESCRPDIVLTDINMPGMNGIEAAGIIKKSRHEAVIIGLCVVQDPYIVNAFLKAGATAVVSKDRFDDLYRATTPAGLLSAVASSYPCRQRLHMFSSTIALRSQRM